MEISRQLEEVLSWRFVTELWRRFPMRFTLIEAHPGGGQYDWLALVTKDQTPQFAIDVNRGEGNVHLHKEEFGLGDGIIVHPDWADRMLHSSPDDFLDDISHEVGLAPPRKLPPSTSETIVYRFISDFLTHSIGRLESWECRNGYADTSGYGGGKRHSLFEKFPSLCKADHPVKTNPFLREDAYSFWFIIRNDDPVLCLDTNGVARGLDGTEYDLVNMYKRNPRIWPLIFKMANDLLP